MSKFNRVIESEFFKIAQDVNFLNTINKSPTQTNSQAGNVPIDYATMNNTQAAQGSATSTTNISAPQVINYFNKAGINPSTYTGKASENEKLRQAINPEARTFYDAYVDKFHKWDQHPSERIDKLSGRAFGLAPSSSTLNAQPVTNSQFTPNSNTPGIPSAKIPSLATPPGFTRTKSGILIPPLPR